MLGRARPESHDSWVTLPDGLNGSVSDPGAVDSRKRRPPAGVTMNGTTTLTSTVKRPQLGVCHVPVYRHKFMGAFFWDYSGYSYSGLGITEYTEFQFRKERQFWKRNTHGGGDMRTTMSAHARAAASDFPPKISQKNAYSVYSE